MADTQGEDIFSGSLHIATLGSGKEFMTYIREVSIGDATGYAVCTDEGVQLAVFGSKDAAYYSARQFDLTPLSVH